MIIAISVRGHWTNRMVDPRFGRAQAFVVVDLESGRDELHDNAQNLQAAQGAGVQAAQNVASFGADAVLTGHVGPKAFAALEAAGIEVYTGVQGTVEEVIEAFQAGRFQTASGADVEGHWT